MDESHRLKPMPANYDKEVFNRIYQQTEGLRRKLAYGIDHRRFGVTQDDIISSFNVKLVYTFTKYYGKCTENILKANCIKALQHFKCRIIKSAYLDKNSQTIVSTEDAVVEDKLVYEPHSSRDYYYEKLMVFMRDHLSENAYVLLDLQLNPPPYILERINPSPEGNLQKVPDELIADYFELGKGKKALEYIAHLKKEIRNTVTYAQTCSELHN
jgi:hypothetical protein